LRLSTRRHPGRLAKPEPLKWLKYRLLAAHGLTDDDYLRRTIHRRPWSQRELLLAEVRDAYEQGIATSPAEGAQLFVVKFVSRAQTMWLPNVRVEKRADLGTLTAALKQAPPGRYDEIWFCRTLVSAGHLSVAGRLLVDRWGGANAQRIEQVWRCSPRLIEQLGEQFPFPFVRASRPGWRWHARIDQVHRPAAAPESREDLGEQFTYSLRLLDDMRERMEAFTDLMASLGLEVCSLEYKIEGNRLRIIDWDTGNDSLALQQWFGA